MEGLRAEDYENLMLRGQPHVEIDPLAAKTDILEALEVDNKEHRKYAKKNDELAVKLLK